LNSASSSQKRFNNNVSEYLREQYQEQSQPLDSNSSVRNTSVSLHKKNEITGYDSQDIILFNYLINNIEQNLEMTKITVKTLEENLNK